MLGLGKVFVIFLFLSVMLAYSTQSIRNGVVLMAIYLTIKAIWNFLTK